MTMTQPDPQGLGDELNQIIVDLTSLEALMSENPERLSAQEVQILKQELAELRTRLKRYLQ
jgi:hypothetical protein